MPSKGSGAAAFLRGFLAALTAALADQGNSPPTTANDRKEGKEKEDKGK